MNPGRTHPKGVYYRCTTLRKSPKFYLFLFAAALIHLAQAKTLLPEANFIHCKLGYCRLLMVGLYFSALSLILRQTIIDDFSQTAHFLAMINYVII